MEIKTIFVFLSSQNKIDKPDSAICQQQLLQPFIQSDNYLISKTHGFKEFVAQSQVKTRY